MFNITFIEDYRQSHNKYKSKIPSKLIFNKKNILLGILRKRQIFNEIRTIGAVEDCRRVVSAEIERYFEQKERTLNGFLPELIIGQKSYAHIFKDYDLETIYTKTNNIIRDKLSERFNSSIVWQVRKATSAEGIPDIFSPILQYQKTKQQTILITSYIEALARRTLSNSIESIMKNSLLAKLVCDVDISTVLLPELGINSILETIDLNEELHNRIGGALYSIKVGLIQEMNNQIANIFYKTHDSQLDAAIEWRIHMLEEDVAGEIHDADLLEA